MKALIYIELIENITHSYEKEIIEWVKLKYPETTVFDFDNFSEASIVQYAGTLLESAEQVLVIVESGSESAGSKMLGIIEKIIKHKEKLQVILNGENKVLIRMLSLLKDRFICDLNIEAQKKIIEKFFKT